MNPEREMKKPGREKLLIRATSYFPSWQTLRGQPANGSRFDWAHRRRASPLNGVIAFAALGL
jgi:hypothetical protein